MSAGGEADPPHEAREDGREHVTGCGLLIEAARQHGERDQILDLVI
jgi:hypothetical protein